MVSQLNGTVNILRNDGRLDFVLQETLPTQFSRTISVADLDQDGDIDISVGGTTFTGGNIDELTLFFTVL